MAEIPLTEPIAIPDTYISGLARIEHLPGENMRFIFYTLQRPLDGPEHNLERVVVARLILSMQTVTSAAMQALAATDTQFFGEPKH